MTRPIITSPPRELDLVKIATLNAINQAHADGCRLVIIDVTAGRAKPMTDAQIDAAVGFGALFEQD